MQNNLELFLQGRWSKHIFKENYALREHRAMFYKANAFNHVQKIIVPYWEVHKKVLMKLYRKDLKLFFSFCMFNCSFLDNC
jgi:hypothetical protein